MNRSNQVIRILEKMENEQGSVGDLGKVPTPAVSKGKQVLISSETNNHRHKYSVDEDGFGVTTSTEGDNPDHLHEIVGYELQPVEDGHSHNIPMPEGWTTWENEHGPGS